MWVEPGQVIVRAGQRALDLYIVVRGCIKVSHPSRDGRNHVSALLAPGELFGEVGLVHGATGTSTAEAFDEGVLLVLREWSLNELLESHPRVAAWLLRLLSSRLRTTNDRVAGFIFLDVRQRVAKTLLDVSVRFGDSNSDGMLSCEGLTQRDLAELAGTSRETVSRAMIGFARRGWISYTPGELTRLDPDCLRVLAEGQGRR